MSERTPETEYMQLVIGIPHQTQDALFKDFTNTLQSLNLLYETFTAIEFFPEVFTHEQPVSEHIPREYALCVSQGRPSRTGYHNKQWAAKMIEVGLMPSDTGLEGGKQTGQRMTHYIVEGGVFDRAADALLATKFRLNWQSGALGERTRPKGKNKVKYTCPTCGQNAWAKPEASLLCGECEEEMEAQDNGVG